MTANRDLDRALGAWLHERATPSTPDGLLERSLARVATTRQRPGWLVGGGWRPIAALGRPPTAPAHMSRLLAIAVAAVFVVIGAGLLLSHVPATLVGPSIPPVRSIVPPSTQVAPTPSPEPSATATLRAGALIAFIRTTDKPNRAPGGCYSADATCPVPRLWIMGSDGSGAHELLPNGLTGQSGAAWSPDGAHLILAESGKLYLTDASGVEPQLVDTGCVAPCRGDWQPAFSSDGTHLVFQRDSTDASGYDGPAAIATMDLATGRVVELSSTAPAGAMFPSWSPDGRQIVFWRPGDKGTGGPIAPKLSAVFVVDADGQNLRQVTPATLAAQFPGWSPDGSRIVFTSSDSSDRQGPGAVGVLHQDIYTVRPDGTDLRRLTTDGTSSRASWTPDGKILFARGGGVYPNGGPTALWTMNADGANPARLIPGMMAGDEDPTWTEGPVWQPIGGPSIVPPPWNPAPATAVGPPPPTPPATPAPALAPGFSWTGSMSTRATNGDTATLLADGRVLIVHGCDTSGSVRSTAAAELYSPTTGTFSPTGSMTATRFGQTATLLLDGRVLITGGYDCPKNAADVPNAAIWATAELYDPATGTFSATGSMSTPREFHTATRLADGRVLITGGITMQAASSTVVLAAYHSATTVETSSNVLSSAEVYDPVTGRFSRTGSMNDFRNNHTATLLEDGRVLVIGGGGEGYASRASAELYDPRTGTFRRTGSMTAGRNNHTATLLEDGRVLVVGGRTPQDSVLASVEVYDPVDGSFSRTGSMKTGRNQHTATLLADGRVLVAGGYWQDASHWNVLSSTEVYDPVTGRFAAVGSMGEARGNQTATLLHDGQVLIAGGSGIGDSGNPLVGLTSAVLYEP